MRQIVILGDVLCTKHIQGIPRYAYEIVRNLDPLVKGMNVTICYPMGEKILIEKLVNIQLLPLKVPEGKRFRKDIVRKYAKANGAIVIDFGPGYSYYDNAVITFHDVRPLEKLGYDSLETKMKYKIMLLMVKYKKKIRIVTVSEYQKKRIHLLTGIPMTRIEVIGNGWEHITRLKADERIFEKIPEISKNEYYYALGSVAPHKNYRWIYEVARNNSNLQFVVAGNIDLKHWGIDDSGLRLKNVIFTGYVSDEENIALMNNCKVFIHPSKYEGFGIPPLEALALGKNVLMSNATCLPEIYGNSVEYFDPDNYSIDFQKHKWESAAERQTVLEKHSWKKSAMEWLSIMKEMAEV